MAEKVWVGPSAYDQGEIRAAVSKGSSNRKTGNLDPLWILVDIKTPLEAAKTGEDTAVCGDCPHRWYGGKLGDCYVTLFQAPHSVKRSTDENC